MDSSVRDSKVNPIGYLDAGKQQLDKESVKMEGSEEQSLLVSRDDDQKKEEVEPNKKRKVQWNDTNGNKLAEIMEFLPSDVDSDEEEPESCFCTIM